MPSEGLVITLWAIALAIAATVVVVVGVLLWLIARTAGDIDAAAARVWVVGQRIANATVHVPLLATTNRIAGAILDRAAGIDAAAAAIEQHAGGCPGCPTCVIGRAGSR